MTKRRRHTLREVAERAGVSIGTASRVLSNNPSVSEEMREAVRRAAAELDYELPRRNSNNGLRTNTAIGVITRDTAGFTMSNPFYSGVLHGIQHAAAELGVGLMYETVPERGDNAWRLPLMLRPVSVQGVMMVGYVSASFVERIKASGLPAVLIDHSFADVQVDTVCNDDHDGARLATKRLIDLGHREPPPAVIAGPLEHGSLYHRLRGYRQALDDADLKYDVSYVRVGSLDAASGYEHANALLDLPCPPTAVFCCNDLMAIGALNALHERGLRIPQDLAIIGYDDIDLAAHTNPPLTTVRVDKSLLGMQAVWHLVERLKHPDIPYRNTRVPVHVVERSTTQSRY